uniref:Uncharacterized protein n=2 Tax=Gammaproteobacteria TaxID=1236 RepID=E7C6U3_9GAMM|nr:hypothetical protein [uncultured Oceanospirillales bacterium HF0500_29K23]ADI23167.1 hypothetical protein [uncultured gamma proteobacterium HF0770_11A05]
MSKSKTRNKYKDNPVYKIFDDNTGEYWYSVTIDDSKGESVSIHTYSTISTTNKNATFEELKNKSIAFLPDSERDRYEGEPVRMSLASGNALSQNKYADGSASSFEFSVEIDFDYKLTNWNDAIKEKGFKPWWKGWF